MEIFIIGGGAAGLSAAISAARNGAKVTVLEAKEKPAIKLLSTGNGKCNFTNMNIGCDSYYADDNDPFIKTFLYNFDSADALNFFESIGVYSRIRSGYVYPISEEASCLRKALIEECEKLGVKIRNNTPVNKIIKLGNEFDIFVDDYIYHADKLIIASGGLSRCDANYPMHMYTVSNNLGHTIVDTKPALTSFKGDKLSSLTGLRTYARIRCGEHVECGEISFSKDGISGVPIMNMCRHYRDESDVFEFDFIPGMTEEKLYSELEKGTPLERFIPEKLAKALLEKCYSPKSLSVKIVSLNDYDYSQVTCGGVERKEINPETMESRIVEGLYFAGEIIDVDGRCGGYNLHFAWGSGIIAGCNASGTKYEHIMPTIEQLRRWEEAEIGTRRGGKNYE